MRPYPEKGANIVKFISKKVIERKRTASGALRSSTADVTGLFPHNLRVVTAHFARLAAVASAAPVLLLSIEEAEAADNNAARSRSADVLTVLGLTRFSFGEYICRYATEGTKKTKSCAYGGVAVAALASPRASASDEAAA